MVRIKYLSLLCTVLFISIISQADSKGDYAIVMPKWLRPHQDLDVCVIIMKESGRDVNVKISLYKAANESLLIKKQETFKPGTENTMTLEIGKAKHYSYQVVAEGSGGITFRKVATISVLRNNVIILIQTDKAIYRPGQKVLFRIMGLNVDLKPYTGTFRVTIKDNSNNKLRETKERNTDKRDCRFVYSDEFQLADEPPLGDWTIEVETDTEQKKYKTFTVEKYVLPKVEVTVLLGSFYHRSMDTLDATIKAQYTFGQAVRGTARVEIYFQNYSPRSTTFQKHVEVVQLVNGKAKVSLTKKDILSLYKCTHCSQPRTLKDYPFSSSYFVFNATVTEQVTGDKYYGDNRIQGKYSLLAMKFLTSTPRNYKPGMTWTGFVKLTRIDGSPLLKADKQTKKGVPLKIEVEFFYKDGRVIARKKEKKLYDVTDDGIIMIEFLSRQKIYYYVDIEVTYPHQEAAASGAEEVVTSHSVEKHITNTGNSIQVSTPDVQAVIQPSNKPVKFEVKTTESITSFYYQIVSKRRIIKKDKVGASGRTNTFTVLFNKPFAHKASPSCKVVVWYLSRKELLVDSIQITVQGTFINDVSLAFSKDKVQPGEQLSLTTKSDPASCVGLLALDKSVLLLKEGNDITRKSVTDQLYVFDNHRRVYRRKRSYSWWYPVYVSGVDTTEVIQNAGLIVLTDAYIHDEPQSGCRITPFPIFSRGKSVDFADDSVSFSEESSPPAQQESDTSETSELRDVFPETWIWMDLFTGKNGMASTNVKAPDTITSWVFSAFSVNGKSGLGIMNNTKELIVFKSCFTDLRLPYSAIRNEILELRAVVFNYLKTMQTITVTLVKSSNDAFYAEGGSNKDPVKVQQVVKTVKVPSNNAKEVNFYIKPVKLGNIPVEVNIQSAKCSDALRKKLLVEAEGEPHEYSKGLFYGLNNGKDSDTVTIHYPSDVVEGSQRILVTAIGDVMGPSVDNLAHLITKPYGCGEQNMVTFAPNIYVLDYLNAADLASAGKVKKITRFMEIGYQRQLTFQRNDGSFSAFGLSDKVGSLWMTAFVARCFQQAKPYIPVEQRTIDRAALFILKHQQKDGSFKEPTGGKIIYSYVQGGVSKGLTLTAYVAKVLVEIKGELTGVIKTNAENAIAKARSYLENVLHFMGGDGKAQYFVKKMHGNVRENAYSLSLTCYFLVNVSSRMADQCLEYLEHLAISEGGKVHWESRDRTNKYKYWRPPYVWPRSNSVEMTAYALLTYCLKGDTDKAAPVARWLATVRTSYGGYRSTQDTVVGLQALATYAAKFPSSTKRGVDVKLRWKGGMHAFDTIKTRNSDIFQQFQVPSAAMLKTLIVEAEGAGTALVQINVFLNKNSSAGESGFKLSVTTVLSDLMVKVKICVVYNLNQSGMVVIEMNMLTSYVPLLTDITGDDDQIKKVEFRGKRLVLYFDEITDKKVCVTVKIKASTKVRRLKPAVISVYSYYESDARDSVLYSLQGAVTG